MPHMISPFLAHSGFVLVLVVFCFSCVIFAARESSHSPSLGLLADCLLYTVNEVVAAEFAFAVLSLPLDQPKSQLLCLAVFGFCYSQRSSLP